MEVKRAVKLLAAFSTCSALVISLHGNSSLETVNSLDAVQAVFLVLRSAVTDHTMDLCLFTGM
jgi:hypothetical protein